MKTGHPEAIKFLPVFLLGTVLLSLSLSACGEPAVLPNKDSLEARVKVYWDLRAGPRNWNAVYDLLDPEERSHMSREAFVQGRSDMLSLIGYHVDSIEVKDQKGVATVTGTWQTSLPNDDQPFREWKSRIMDSWVFSDGSWYLQWSQSKSF